jgi:peptidylprolyl isomerase
VFFKQNIQTVKNSLSLFFYWTIKDKDKEIVRSIHRRKQMIQDGKFALVHYTGTLSDGEVFDSTDGREPFEFETGQGFVIPAFEETVKSMAVDEEREISIKAADAYGEYKEDMIQKVPAAEVTEFLTPEVGLIIHVMTQDGQQIPARITGVTTEEISLDFNHPLAGKDLNFKLKLIGVNDAATQEHGCGCGCGGDCGDDCEEDGECSCGCDD